MTTGAREMVVFISYENAGSPEATGRQMVEALRIGQAEYGVDMFTGGCEVRVGYDALLLGEIRAWLEERKVIHDINFVG